MREDKMHSASKKKENQTEEKKQYWGVMKCYGEDRLWWLQQKGAFH